MLDWLLSVLLRRLAHITSAMRIDNIRLVTAPDISWHGKKTKKCSYKFLTKVLEVDTRGVPNHEMLTVHSEYMFICIGGAGWPRKPPKTRRHNLEDRIPADNEGKEAREDREDREDSGDREARDRIQRRQRSRGRQRRHEKTKTTKKAEQTEKTEKTEKSEEIEKTGRKT